MSTATESRRLFGTDGVRGRANQEPMTTELALRLGMAVGKHFGTNGEVVIGKDTRLSGYMFETAFASGLCSVGVDVLLVGPLPTPAIAHITHSMRADAGVVISASHNPYYDNGIKLFASDGFKLPDEVEHKLESWVLSEDLSPMRASAEMLGKARRIEDSTGRYIAHVKQSFPRDLSLDGLKVVVDCAHGAAYKVGPAVFAELGAEVIATGVEPDGRNINEGVGALYPDYLAQRVREHGADLGIALDGDADRAVLCDAQGGVLDGDLILAIGASDLEQRNRLKGGAVVATVMSNLGLERFLETKGLKLLRTSVGDRHVVEAMRKHGCNLGGEQSGHIINLDHATTGDGLVAALQVIAAMIRTGKPLSELRNKMERYPQISRSFPVDQKKPLDTLSKTQKEIAAIEDKLGAEGRVLVRYSGTESKLRIMVEGTDEAMLKACVDGLGEIACAELKGS